MRHRAVWDAVAERLCARPEPCLERWKVVGVSPLRITQLEGSLTLQEGDPDLAISQTVRSYNQTAKLAVGDTALVRCTEGEYVLYDVVSKTPAFVPASAEAIESGAIPAGALKFREVAAGVGGRLEVPLHYTPPTGAGYINFNQSGQVANGVIGTFALPGTVLEDGTKMPSYFVIGVRGQGSLTLVNQDATGEAAARIACSAGENLLIPSGHMETLQYDHVMERWRNLGVGGLVVKGDVRTIPFHQPGRTYLPLGTPNTVAIGEQGTYGVMTAYTSNGTSTEITIPHGRGCVLPIITVASGTAEPEESESAKPETVLVQGSSYTVVPVNANELKIKLAAALPEWHVLFVTVVG